MAKQGYGGRARGRSESMCTVLNKRSDHCKGGWGDTGLGCGESRYCMHCTGEGADAAAVSHSNPLTLGSGH